MRIRIIVVISLFLFVPSVLAHPPRPYVGGALQRIWTSEVEYPNPRDDTPEPWISYSGFALQIEGGWSGDFWSAYSGLRHDVGSHSWNSGASAEWTAERIVLGARLRVSDHDPNPIKPLLGAGVSLGWGRRGWEDEHVPTVHDAYSKAGCGWLGEAGIGFRVQKSLMILLMLRFEDLGLQLERWDYGDPTRTVQQFSLSVGACYRLGKAAAIKPNRG